MTGGEPTIIKRNLDYIDKMIQNGHAGDVELIFTTNATNINKNFIEKSKKFKSVSFNVSIDAVGKLANYIRNPSDWNTIDKNMKTLYKNGMGVSFNTTIQWLNMTRLSEIFSYLKNSDIEFGGIWLQLVTDPHYLDPVYAPTFMKEKCINDIEHFLHDPYLNNSKHSDILSGQFKTSLIETKNFLTKNLKNVKYTEEFLKRMKILDRIRGQDLFSVLPELKQIGG